MKRDNILISEDYTTKRVSVTKFTTGNVPAFDCSIHFGEEGNDVTMQNCTIEDNAIVKCSPDDTYDFETGALIALMKMCGRDKVTKACDELYRDDNYKNALQETTENNEKLIKENNYLKYIKSCRESAIKSLENTRDLLINKNNELVEENEKLKADKTKSWKNYQRNIQKKQDRINELNNIEEKYIKLREEYDTLFEEKEKLQHDYDLCKNSENALKCSVDYLNKAIAKLNLAIFSYKNELYKEADETINNNEYKYLESFSVVRRNGKQLEQLVDLFKKVGKEKVHAAYLVAFDESIVISKTEPEIKGRPFEDINMEDPYDTWSL